MARPTEYKPEYAAQAEKLALLGATDMQVADFFGVAVSTVHRWKIAHEEFCDSLKTGKNHVDAQVERSLLNRALGYEHDAVKIFCGKDGEVTQVPYREIVPPDTTACIFWLKNRKKEEWRDKHDYEHSGEVGIKRILVPERISTVASSQNLSPEFK